MPGVIGTNYVTLGCLCTQQWDHQEIVIKARKHLQARGVSCWMDIDGGMKSDLYDSMAEGVTGAAVVVAFMSSAYELSENCQLGKAALTYACACT